MRLLLVVLGMSVCCGAAAQDDAAVRCTALTGVKLEKATIASASMVAAGTALPELRRRPAAAKELPPFCRVQLVDRPSADSEIHTEVWLPAAGWSGRYRGQGNGGFAGVIAYGPMAEAVLEGDATAGTDTGHTGGEPSFALGHPEKVVDFGWRAVHDMTLQAKALVNAFYGKAPSKSYFTACSDGGREALMEAERFPVDYDGILAGAPAWDWTSLVGGAAILLKTLNATPDAAIPAEKIPAIAAAVRAACDAQDGVKDGVVNDPRKCGFDPATIVCKAGDDPSCLLPAQVATLKTLYAGPVDPAGKRIMPGLMPGGEEGNGGWSNWVTGTAKEKSQADFFGVGFEKNFVAERADWTIADFDPSRDLKLAEAKTGKALNATDTNLKPFFARGGKLVMYHGWNDPAIPPPSTIAYWNAVRSSAGAQAEDASVKLYMVPGMQHCAGGPGATDFGQAVPLARGDAAHDVVTALEQWVEAGKVPGTIVARKPATPAGGPGFTRPICVYPAVARYVSGDTNEAASFVCDSK